ncbi:endonuclease [Phytohabitans suffuscus]|uniref:Endonuclease n=1 Tax=Phytohabitans suffuscus TaxID=624315 RepID=A0A6F8YQ28_9ACTN|nr:endonuclease [Phytohabitans suffuscus]
MKRYGRTYAEEAGIRLADRPGPLYQLLVLATLLSTRISTTIAVAAARQLFAAGCRTPRAMREASWQDRVDALGRAHYRRYDERTATMLGKGAELCLTRWHDDLRRLRREAGRDERALRRLLIEFPGIGPTGADIFLREAQAVWTDLAPYVDRKVVAGAQRLDLPASAAELSGLVARDEVTRLASALVRVSIDRRAADEVRAEVAARR